MSSFVLPDETENKIQSHIRELIWKNTSTRKALNMISWNTMCLPKQWEGSGIRYIHWFYTALMMEKCQNLLHKSNSLLARTLKAKYFPSTVLWKSTALLFVSWTWGNLSMGLKYLKNLNGYSKIGRQYQSGLMHGYWINPIQKSVLGPFHLPF